MTKPSASLDSFPDEDKWKGLILFGLNAATYKMALAKCLFNFVNQKKEHIQWDELAFEFLKEYQSRISLYGRPQQGNPTRLTVMERVVKELSLGTLSMDKAVGVVADKGLDNVIPRFHTIGRDPSLLKEHFYSFEFGKKIQLKDSLLGFTEDQLLNLEEEFTARWGLLEGAFAINQNDFELANDIRDIYLQNGSSRIALTKNIPFLNGYQGNTCFYCGEKLSNDIHVDHVLPRQVLMHDEIWNLVLAHGDCNLLKSDRLVGPHFIKKLIARNENIMGSNHPWKNKIANSLGNTAKQRSSNLTKHYENMKTVLGTNYWGGSDNYNPATDPFYKKLITVLNNKN